MYQVRHPMAIDSLLLQNILQRLKGIFSGELFFPPVGQIGPKILRSGGRNLCSRTFKLLPWNRTSWLLFLLPRCFAFCFSSFPFAPLASDRQTTRQTDLPDQMYVGHKVLIRVFLVFFQPACFASVAAQQVLHNQRLKLSDAASVSCPRRPKHSPVDSSTVHAEQRFETVCWSYCDPLTTACCRVVVLFYVPPQKKIAQWIFFSLYRLDNVIYRCW